MHDLINYLTKSKIREKFRQLVEEGREGFTLRLDGEEYSEPRGFAVAAKSCKTVDEALEVVRTGQLIGWWVDPETKETFIEVVDLIENGLSAILTGIQRNQKAIYNFKDDKIIDLSGFYTLWEPPLNQQNLFIPATSTDV